MRPHPIWVTVDAEASLMGVQAFLREALPWGVILFARHLKSPEQVRELNDCIHGATAGWRPRIALDQEGGRVNRLSALGMRFPSAADLSGDPARAEELALEMGGHLKDLGFDVDFAPVADLGPAFPGTGLEGRVYADDAEGVTACCGAFLKGLARADVEGCLKHFPGLGGSGVDSHQSLPTLEGDGTARTSHFAPYSALKDLAAYVMIAHGSYPALLGSEQPSTLCPRTYELLAGTGFSGLSVTDDLRMGAVSGLGTLADLAGASLLAGARLALWVSSQEDSLRALDGLRGTATFVAGREALPYR